jgi:hypothetical protein
LLEEQVAGLRLPTEAEEVQDPEGADAVYELAVGALRERTRDTNQYPPVPSENARYGFRRNVLGLRPYGIATSLIGLELPLNLQDGRTRSLAVKHARADAVASLARTRRGPAVVPIREGAGR